jgi:hypothetical protein
MRLRYPNKADPVRLMVGNSPSGNHPWAGAMYGLAFYDRYFDDAAVKRHYQIWHVGHDFNVFKGDGPRLLYAFDEGKGQVVHNKAGGGSDLTIPEHMMVLQKKVLSWPQLSSLTRASMVLDVAQNLVGFVPPLGFILMWLLSCIEGLSLGSRRLIVVLIAFVFSFSIEIAQVWIPSRDSSILDLILNTLGGYLGVVLFAKVHGY